MAAPRKALRRRRGPARLACLVFVLTAGLVSGIAWMLLAPTTHPPVYSPGDAESASASLNAKKAAIRRDIDAASRGQAVDFSYEFSEMEINALLKEPEVRDRLTQRKIEDAYVLISGTTMLVFASKDVAGVTATVSAQLVPYVTPDRRVGARLEGLSLGRLGMPRAAADRLTAEISRLLSRRALARNLAVRDVHVEAGKVIIKGGSAATSGKQLDTSGKASSYKL